MLRGQDHFQAALTDFSFIPCGLHGIHLDQEIIFKLKKEALKRKLKTALYMFYPHPQTVLAPEKNFKRLFTLEETQNILESFGLDFFGVIPFDLKLSKWSPEEFVSSFIVPHLKPRLIVVGYDFSFGSQRLGNVSHLKSLSRNWHFEVQQIPPLLKKGEPVSTSRIKKLLSRASIRGGQCSFRTRVLFFRDCG